jgi:predicted phosphodiesterase
MPNILFFGDNHGHFRHIIDAVEREKPDAIVLLGDVQAQNPLEVELAPILGKTIIRLIHGNHDTDNDFDFRNLFGSKLADANLHGRVEVIAGVRIAGLGGIFRGKVWMPPEGPKFDSYADWLLSTERRPSETNVDRWTQARTHHSTIFWDVYSRLWDQKADVLVTHEAPSVHPHGFAAIDELAAAMGVTATFHGHHHDSLDYRAEWDRLGFKAYGVGFCGITDLDGRVIRPGDFDEDRAYRNERVNRS